MFDIALPVPGPAAGGEGILVARLNEAWIGEIQDRVLAASATASGPVTNGVMGLSILAPDARPSSGLMAQQTSGAREVVEQATPSAGFRDLAPSGWLAVARVTNAGAPRSIEASLPDNGSVVLWLAVCLLTACGGWIVGDRIVRRLKLIGESEQGVSSPSRIAELSEHEERLVARERSGVRALQETRSALSRIRERFRTFESMSGWTYWEIDTEAGSVTWSDPATHANHAVPDRAVALTDLKSGIAPDDRDLMDFTMRSALDQPGPHDVVLRTTGSLAENGQRRLFVRFIRAEDETQSAKPTILHALSREFVGETVKDPNFVGGAEAEGSASPVERRRRETDGPVESRTGTVLRKVVDGVIHDFNNVLTVVIANLATLQRRHDLPSNQARLIDAALAGAQRGSSLTRRLVNFVRRDDSGLQETDVAVTLTAFVPFLGANVLHQTSVETRIRPGLAKVLCSEKVLEAVPSQPRLPCPRHRLGRVRHRCRREGALRRRGDRTRLRPLRADHPGQRHARSPCHDHTLQRQRGDQGGGGSPHPRLEVVSDFWRMAAVPPASSRKSGSAPGMRPPKPRRRKPARRCPPFGCSSSTATASCARASPMPSPISATMSSRRAQPSMPWPSLTKRRPSMS